MRILGGDGGRSLGRRRSRRRRLILILPLILRNQHVTTCPFGETWIQAGRLRCQQPVCKFLGSCGYSLWWCGSRNVANFVIVRQDGRGISVAYIVYERLDGRFVRTIGWMCVERSRRRSVTVQQFLSRFFNFHKKPGSVIVLHMERLNGYTKPC